MTIIRMDSASWCFALFLIFHILVFFTIVDRCCKTCFMDRIIFQILQQNASLKKNPNQDHLVIYNRMMLSLFWILGFPKCSNFESCGNHHFVQIITLGIYSKNWILIKLIKFNMIIIFLFYDMYYLIFPTILSEQNRTEQNRTEQNRTEQNRIEQNRTERNRTEQNRTEQNRTEQNRTEQNRTERNGTEWRMRKDDWDARFWRDSLWKGFLAKTGCKDTATETRSTNEVEKEKCTSGGVQIAVNKGLNQ